MSDAIVIGGGILGTATAWRLAERGVTVTLLESEPGLGQGASRASFAWLNSSNKPPLHYHLLNTDGMSFYRRLANELDNPRWLHFDGHIEWDASEQGCQRLREKVSRLREWGYTAELLPISELRGLEPELVAPESVEEFAYFAHEGYINPVDMIGDFAMLARQAGATIETGTCVAQLIVEHGRVKGVVTAQGEKLYADTVVSATGAVSPALLRGIDLDLPMAPTTGMVAVSSPTTARLKAVHHDEQMNIHPDGAGRIMMRHYDFDAMCTPGMPETPLPGFLNDLLARVATVLPSIASATIETMRVVTRPIPGDGFPVVGTVPGAEGLYLLVMHSAVTMGPLMGAIAAREITTGRLDERLTHFRPDRAIGAATKPFRENG